MFVFVAGYVLTCNEGPDTDRQRLHTPSLDWLPLALRSPGATHQRQAHAWYGQGPILLNGAAFTASGRRATTMATRESRAAMLGVHQIAHRMPPT